MLIALKDFFHALLKCSTNIATKKTKKKMPGPNLLSPRESNLGLSNITDIKWLLLIWPNSAEIADSSVNI